MQSAPESNVIESTSDAEVENYLAETCVNMETNVLDCWRINQTKFPILAKLSEKFLFIPASSASVERLICIAGKVFRPERCNLKDSTFHTLMMINCNGTILKNKKRVKQWTIDNIGDFKNGIAKYSLIPTIV